MTTQATQSSSLPLVRGAPLVGVLPDILRHHHGALDRWFEIGGDLFRVKLAGVELHVIANGRLAADTFNSHRNELARSPLFNDGMRVVTGDSVLTLQGEAWRERRRILQPHFQAKVMSQIAPRICAELDAIIDGLEPGPVELSSLSNRVSMSVTLRVLFGHSMPHEVFDELCELAPSIIARIGLGWISTKLPSWMPMPGEAGFRRSMDRLAELIFDMANKRRELGELGDDLLATLLHMVDEGSLDQSAVRDEAATMLLAGYETTANTLSWTLHSIAERPEVAAKIRAEARDAFARGTDPSELPYALAAFKEGLRLHPAALWVMRLLLDDIRVGECVIEKGETIVVSTHLVQRNPSDWPEPTRFDPGRFLDTAASPAFIPFGLGPMLCIGKHLALLEGQLMLAKLFASWDLVPDPARPPRKRIATTLSNIDGIHAELKRPRD